MTFGKLTAHKISDSWVTYFTLTYEYLVCRTISFSGTHFVYLFGMSTQCTVTDTTSFSFVLSRRPTQTPLLT